MPAQVTAGRGGARSEPPVVAEFRRRVPSPDSTDWTILDIITPGARGTGVLRRFPRLFRFMGSALNFVHEKFGVNAGVYLADRPGVDGSVTLVSFLEHSGGGLRIPDHAIISSKRAGEEAIAFAFERMRDSGNTRLFYSERLSEDPNGSAFGGRGFNVLEHEAVGFLPLFAPGEKPAPVGVMWVCMEGKHIPEDALAQLNLLGSLIGAGILEARGVDES